MAIPNWIKSTVKEMAPELIAEFIGVQSIKKLLNKGRKKADESATRTSEDNTAEEEEKEEIKHDGIFTLSDETVYFKLISLLKESESSKISAFLNTHLEPWQRRRFRVAVGNLGEIIIPPTSEWISLKKSDVVEDATPKTAKKMTTAYESKEVKSGGSSKSLGVKFLKSFAKLTEDQMLDVCEAAGIMHSDFEAVKQAWKKLTDWAEAQGPELINKMDALSSRLDNYAQTRPKTTKSCSFLRRFFGLY